MKINTKSPTEQHASWLASNPVVGCPMGCAYCFLRPEGLNRTKPRILFSAKEALNDLVSSVFYTKDIPVATGTRTDYFATPENIYYLKKYLVQYNERKLKNPLVMMTKRKVPDDVIDLLLNLQDKGSTFLFFLSYSGIGDDIEKNVNHREIKDNFKRLNEAKLNVIHYWRPFIPQNSTKEVMAAVLRHAMKYAKASVIAGLRFTPRMKAQFWFWKDIQNLKINLSNVEGIWPRHVKDYLGKFMKKYPQYPIGYASSCAIANALGIPDYNGFYNTEVCDLNSCPDNQRRICRKFYENHIVTDDMIEKVLARLKIKKIRYKIDRSKRTLILFDPLDHAKIVNLTQSLKIHVEAKEKSNDDYGWGSSVAQRKPYYIDIK